MTAQLEAGLEAGLEHFGIDTTPEARMKLLGFVELLARWNRVYNLTAVRDPKQMLSRHVLDSLSVLNTMPLADPAREVDVVDIGTGAGLPVIPLAILRPDLRFVSVESNGKKTRFQRQVLIELGIGNIDVQEQRIESFDAPAAVVIARAFTAPAAFLTFARPLLIDGGRAVIMLGQAERLPDALPAGFRLASLEAVEVPGVAAPRHVAVCIHE